MWGPYRGIPMRAFRLVPHGHTFDTADDALDGNGSAARGGRWNHAATRLTYASTSASLALLESLAVDGDPPFDVRTLVEVEVPGDSVEEVGLPLLLQLLEGAPTGEPERPTRDFGTDWARACRSLALLVPSVVMPVDCNVLLNPNHPRMAEVRVVRSTQITLDPRIRRRLERR
jgi:RES domain-containing protein